MNLAATTLNLYLKTLLTFMSLYTGFQQDIWQMTLVCLQN